MSKIQHYLSFNRGNGWCVLIDIHVPETDAGSITEDMTLRIMPELPGKKVTATTYNEAHTAAQQLDIENDCEALIPEHLVETVADEVARWLSSQDISCVSVVFAGRKEGTAFAYERDAEAYRQSVAEMERHMPLQPPPKKPRSRALKFG